MTNTWRAMLQDFVGARSGREKILLGFGFLLTVLWIGVVVVWQPLQLYRTNLEAKIARYEIGLATLQDPAFSVSEVQVPSADSRPVPVLVADTAAVFQLVIRRLEAEDTGARVVLEEATFEQVVLWIEALERDHGLRVRDLEMTRRPAPGTVSVTLALER